MGKRKKTKIERIEEKSEEKREEKQRRYNNR